MVLLGVAIALVLVAVGGTSTASAAKCLGKKATLAGSAGKDAIKGGKTGDVVRSKGGADSVKTKAGDDRICSGGGGDAVNAGGGEDQVKAGGGDDSVKGGGGDDVLDGSGGNDTVDGGPGTDTCINAETVVNCELPPSTPPPPPPPPTPALHYDDQVDWGFSSTADEANVVAGDRVNTVLRIANGMGGQAGYTSNNVTSEPFLPGTSTPITFTEGKNADDANTLINLPFPVDFFGARYTQAQVSTNGWIGFGSPALDYFPDYEPNGPAEIGDYYRGVMPYWSDLWLGVTTVPGDRRGTVTMVTATDAFAIQWRELSFCCPTGPADRNFQVVFFADGRIRFDYPGDNPPAPGTTGGIDELVGISGGTGAASFTEVQRATRSVPGTSILFTPNPTATAGETGPGTATAVLPAGTTFVPEATDPRCAQTTAPTASANGEASCSTPSLAAGAQDSFQVAWNVPPNVPTTTEPPDMSFSARWIINGFDLIDPEQLLLTTH